MPRIFEDFEPRFADKGPRAFPRNLFFDDWARRDSGWYRNIVHLSLQSLVLVRRIRYDPFMRVIAGTAKGRTLVGPKTHSIRPALDKIKGAIFNILFDVSDLAVLDVFAGTGSIGIEALSRGAKRAVFLDASAEALAIVKKNLELCRFEDRATVLRTKLPEDLRAVAKRSGIDGFDLIFVDPPYDKDLVNASLRKVAELGLLAAEGKIIVEHSPREAILEIPGLAVTDRREYGQTVISFLSNAI